MSYTYRRMETIYNSEWPWWYKKYRYIKELVLHPIVWWRTRYVRRYAREAGRSAAEIMDQQIMEALTNTENNHE